MSFFYDHEFDNGDGGKTNKGTCISLVEKHEPNDNNPEGYISDRGTFVSLQPCGRDWTSSVHPPDQFRHWCSILEQGGDCMHFEMED